MAERSLITQEQVSKPNETAMDRAPCQTRVNNLLTEQQKWVPSWKEMAKHLNPTRGCFSDNTPNQGLKIDHKTIIDNYARRCIRDFASGMMSGLTSPARPWFKLGLQDRDLQEYEPVKLYLDDVAMRMHYYFGNSNIYESLHTAYEEICSFGTAALFLMEDFNEVIRARVFTIGEYMLGTGPDCRVNTFSRRCSMTVSQLIREFGFESCSPTVRQAFKAHNTEQWVKVILLIEENDKRIEGYKDYKNMPYRSVYWEESSQPDTYLRIEGFEEFPVMGPRWALTTTADIYGKSPGWDALGDVKMLQEEQREKLLALAKIGDPPMQADASVQNVNTLPGGLTRSSATTPNAGVRPAYQVNPDINAFREDIMEIKKALDDAFYRDLFRAILNIERTGVTATEIAEKKAEQLNLISPVVLRLTNELNNPLIERAYYIMNRMGALPPPPREIQDADLKIQYISVLAQAQRMIGVSSIERNVNFGTAMAGINPEVLDNYDFDATAKEYAEAIGAPAKTMASPEKVAAKRKARIKAQAAVIKAQQMQASVEIAGKGAKAIKDAGTTPVGKGSALDKIASMMPGGK